MFRGPMSDARCATTPERRPAVPRSIVIALQIHVQERNLWPARHVRSDHAALRLRFDLVLRPLVDVLARVPRLCRRASMRLMTLSVRSGGTGSSMVCPLDLRRISFFSACSYSSLNLRGSNLVSFVLRMCAARLTMSLPILGEDTPEK